MFLRRRGRKSGLSFQLFVEVLEDEADTMKGWQTYFGKQEPECVCVKEEKNRDVEGSLYIRASADLNSCLVFLTPSMDKTMRYIGVVFSDRSSCTLDGNVGASSTSARR